MQIYKRMAGAILLTAAIALAQTDDTTMVEITGTMVVEKGVPSGVIIETSELRAKAAAIDLMGRKATLLGPLGNMLTVQAEPDAVDFDQLRRNQYVPAVITRTLEVYLGGADAGKGAEPMVMLAPPGAMPGGLIVGNFRITATITSIDLDQRTAVLQFPDGSHKTVTAREDLDLDHVKVDQHVVILVSEAVSIAAKKE